MYAVAALRYGTRATRKSECYLDYGSYGEPDEPIGMDYFFWLLRSDAATIVVDTGFDPDVGARRGRTCLYPPVDALRRVGVEPESVETVILTHLHYDHTGNVAAFPQARLVVQRCELEFWTSEEARGGRFAPHVEWADIDRVAAGRLRLLDGDEEIAPGIEAVCVGGHSRGQMVLAIDGATGPVVLASDAVHYYEELELDRPFLVYDDLVEMHAGYVTVRELVDSRDAALVVGHDPEVMNRFPSLDGDGAGLGVRVA